MTKVLKVARVGDGWLVVLPRAWATVGGGSAGPNGRP